jgi:hypothetical protein
MRTCCPARGPACGGCARLPVGSRHGCAGRRRCRRLAVGRVRGRPRCDEGASESHREGAAARPEPGRRRTARWARGVKVMTTVLTSRGRVRCGHHRPGSLRAGCAPLDVGVGRAFGPSDGGTRAHSGCVPGQAVCNRFATGWAEGPVVTGPSDNARMRRGGGRRLWAMVAGGAAGAPVGTWIVLFTGQVGSTAMRVRVGEEALDAIGRINRLRCGRSEAASPGAWVRQTWPARWQAPRSRPSRV